MKIGIDLDLLIEVRDGLKAYGKAATEATVQKINDAISEAVRTSFSAGNNVNVRWKKGDMFNNDFTGHVKDISIKCTIVEEQEYVIVEDQAGDCWSCDPDQVTHSSDDIMHN
jgi:hypothetical protein